MPPRKYKRKITRKPSRKSAVSYKKKTRGRKGFTTLIKRVIARQAEKKNFVYTATLYPQVLQGTTSSLSGNYLVCTPSSSTFGPTMARGTGDGNYIGNKFTIKNYVHQFVLTPTLYNATQNTQVTPCWVRLYYFKNKYTPVGDLVANNFNSVGTFFNGGTTTLGFSGSLIDLTRKIDNQNFTYLTHRTFKIGPAAPATTSGTTSYHPYTNNDFKLSVIGKVNLSKYFKKPITINDASITMTPWVYCLIQVLSATGVILATTQLPILMQSEFIITYTDE